MQEIFGYSVTYNTTTHNNKLNAGETWNVRPKSKGYTPFNTLRIMNNNNTVTLQVFINGLTTDNSRNARVETIKPSETYALESKDGVLFDFIDIKNTHATDNVADGEVTVRIGRVV